MLFVVMPWPMSGETTVWRVGYQSEPNGNFPLVAEGWRPPMATPRSLPRPTALVWSAAVC
jgi:hypothetical protein